MILGTLNNNNDPILLTGVRNGDSILPGEVEVALWPSGMPPWIWDAINKIGIPIAPRRLRTLLAIYNDLVNLSAGQKTAVWNDLTSGSPVKISQDVGKNADGIFSLWRISSQASLPVAAVNDMKLTAATYYVQDNPKYLINPSFDPTINVPGDELVP